MSKNIKQTWIVDGNGNRCSVEFFGSEKAAQAALDGLKNCTNCTNCTDCGDCSRCSRCTNCYSCTDCTDCGGCTDCTDCTDCTNCSRCTDCGGCGGCSGRSDGRISVYDDQLFLVKISAEQGCTSVLVRGMETMKKEVLTNLFGVYAPTDPGQAAEAAKLEDPSNWQVTEDTRKVTTMTNEKLLVSFFLSEKNQEPPYDIQVTRVHTCERGILSGEIYV